MRISFHATLAVVVVGIVGLVLTPYFLWHEQMDAYFVSEPYQEWLVSVKPYAWLIGLGLIVADLFLPIPVPPVMATMGALYGTVIGGMLAAFGSILAGLVAYCLARLAGRKGARWLANDRELSDFQRFFDTWGVAGIVASRALPVLPEVLTLLAGLARMRFLAFSGCPGPRVGPDRYGHGMGRSCRRPVVGPAAGADTGTSRSVVRLSPCSCPRCQTHAASLVTVTSWWPRAIRGSTSLP